MVSHAGGSTSRRFLHNKTDMNTCMTGTTVTFDRPFRLAGMTHARPPGRYRVEHFFLLADTAPQLSYERTCSFIHFHPADGVGVVQQFPVEPDDLREALKRDQGRCSQPDTPSANDGGDGVEESSVDKPGKSDSRQIDTCGRKGLPFTS